MTHVLSRAFLLEREALKKWGVEAQRLMVCEEAGELTTAVAQHARGRATPEEVLDEAADACIAACIAVLVVGKQYGDLLYAIEQKCDRLESRLYPKESQT